MTREHTSASSRATFRIAGAAMALLVASGVAEAASWQQTMVAETDTVVFLMSGGELVRAPFHLAHRETLWRPTGDQHVTRMIVAPDRRQIAWLVRGGHRGPTELWVAGLAGPGPTTLFPSLVPGDFGSLHFEAETPTTADPVIRGARLLAPAATGRGRSTNAVEWTLDGRGVLCGSARGLILSPTDSGAARLLSADRLMTLQRLEPSPIYLGLLQQQRAAAGAPGPSSAEGGTPGPTQTVDLRVLVYLAGGKPRLYESSGLDPTDAWTASDETVWWIHHNTVRAVRANDPRPTVEVDGHGPISWIEWDDHRRALHWASGARLLRRHEGSSEDSLVFELDAPIRQVLAPARGRVRLVVTDSRLVLWDLADDSRRSFAGEHLRVQALFLAAGKAFVAVTRGDSRNAPLELHRLDYETSRLLPLPVPALKGARLASTPSGSKLIFFRPGSKSPASLQILDLERGDWTEVSEPGLTAWEPLGG